MYINSKTVRDVYLKVIALTKSHGQRSLAGYSPLGHKKLDMTKELTYTIYSQCYPGIIKLNVNTLDTYFTTYMWTERMSTFIIEKERKGKILTIK